jgi:hypothetical protein
MIGIGRRDQPGSGDQPAHSDPTTTRQLRALSERLGAIEGRLVGLHEEVDYVRHVSETARSTLSMVARRPCGAEPIRVLFLVHNPEAWYSLQDVHAAMVASDDFRVVVASLPRHFPGSDQHKDEDFVHERLQAFGVPHLRFNNPDPFLDLDIVRAIDPHVIFRQSQWDGDVPVSFHTPEIRFARLCLVPYETMNILHNRVTDDGIANTAVDTIYHRNCWKIFCTNDEMLAMAAESAQGTGARQYVVTGHPKADLLRRFAVPRPPGRRFTVLWSAHHSVGEDWARFGTFHTSASAMLQAAREHPEWDFIFSPHPALISQFARGATPLDTPGVRSFRPQWDALPNTEVFGGGDYGPVFERSDVCISDGLSWLIEFQLVNKPVIFIERPGHQPFNTIGVRVMQGAHTVAQVADGVQLMERFAAGEEDPLREAQRQIASELFGPPGAAERIVDAVRAGFRGEAASGRDD